MATNSWRSRRRSHSASINLCRRWPVVTSDPAELPILPGRKSGALAPLNIIHKFQKEKHQSLKSSNVTKPPPPPPPPPKKKEKKKKKSELLGDCVDLRKIIPGKKPTKRSNCPHIWDDVIFDMAMYNKNAIIVEYIICYTKLIHILNHQNNLHYSWEVLFLWYDAFYVVLCIDCSRKRHQIPHHANTQVIPMPLYRYRLDYR